MKQQTTIDDGPIDLAPPLDRPEPAEGCEVCAALARQRATAEAGGDWSRVSDCNIELRGHSEPHVSRRRAARSTTAAGPAAGPG
ncbi:hypothetical protein ACFV06_15205 [Streptomyces sp. NPDC059618]|uniref:hypothetical protein n=1 Tax=Streptomyces sp. NPDC059618 TaxID=3346887 RepID=UPI0036CBB9E0